MQVTSGQKIKTGLVALGGLLLLGGAIFFIGKTKNMFGETFHLYGTFRNVGGLQVGNNVRFVGVNVGTVENIQIISDSFARVDMILEANANPFIKKNAVATIGSDGLMGDKLIVISATSPESKMIADGAMIITNEPADLGKTMEKIDRIADNAEVITYSIAGITSRINEGKGSIGRLLNDDKIYKNLEGTTTAMQEGTRGFKDNMNALKGNFLFKGYYKRKERKKQEAAEERKEAEEERKEALEEKKEKETTSKKRKK